MDGCLFAPISIFQSTLEQGFIIQAIGSHLVQHFVVSIGLSWQLRRPRVHRQDNSSPRQAYDSTSCRQKLHHVRRQPILASPAMTAGASARTVPAALPSLFARCPLTYHAGSTSIDSRGSRTWRQNMVPVGTDENTGSVTMTTVMSVHNVSGPVNPVSIKSGPVGPVAVVLVPVGVCVGIILDGFPLGEGMLPDAYFLRIGEDMVEGGPARVVPGGPSFGETRPLFHSVRKARVRVFQGSVGKRRFSEPRRITYNKRWRLQPAPPLSAKLVPPWLPFPPRCTPDGEYS